jgi:glycerophosphoryl diester phosphodiesterase
MAPDLSWLTARPIAHRGLHDRSRHIIENTDSAFAGAIDGGYAIECDLQLTRDGEAVVFHDDVLDRLTEATGRVIDRSSAEMKQIAIRGTHDRVQTISDLLDQVRGRVPLVIELKSHWDGSDRLVRRVVDCVAGYSGDFGLMSFDPDVVSCLRRLAPGMTRGLVAERATDSYYAMLPLARRRALQTLSHLPETRPQFISFYFRELPWAPIAAYRAAGHPVISWTIRSQAQAKDALRHTDQITFENFAPAC